MFKNIIVHATFNERTGYGIHASRFFPALDKLHRSLGKATDSGDVHISLVDSVSIQNINERLPYPSILFNVWESTAQPDWFMERLKYFDQLWVASEAQRGWSIAQGVPEEFVKTVPEGVDPDVYKPLDYPVEHKGLFNFVCVGGWQPRKSTEEICKAFIAAFPNNPDVRLHLSADTLFPSDNYKSTEERLEAYGINDSRIIPVHFEEREDYIRRLQGAHCFVSCARSEGWGLPIIEAMACFTGSTMVIANDVEKSMVRDYTGELVVIELDDTTIEATPEHPFWTKKGWKLAKELDITDQLLYCPNYGGQKNETIYAGRIRDIEEAVSDHYSNGVIEDNGKNLFFGIMEKTSDGADQEIREHSEISSFGYKSHGFELSGRNYRWRGDCYVKEDDEQVEASGANSEYFGESSNVAKGKDSGPVDLCRPSEEQREQGTVIHLCGNGNILSPSLQTTGTPIGHKKETYADNNRILRDTAKTGFSHPEYGTIDESYFKGEGTEYKAIRSIRIIETENLPVYNLKTQSGLYTANGYMVHNCGIPTIVADWSGSTEYAHDAIRVPIAKLIKPFGIYGNWDVPGQWCEPDFKMLESRMQYVVKKYDYEKGRALETSEKIRKEFSWDAAAEKAFKHLQELHKTVERRGESRNTDETSDDAAMEKAIRMRARKGGYEITEMHKSKIIFTIDCHPSSQERLDTLSESIRQVKKLGYDVLVTSHLPLPQPIIDEVDYYIYDKRDILSGDDLPVYSRVGTDGELEKKQASIPCHALAWLHNMRNAIDFCKGRYEWIYNMSFDAECDLADWIDKVKSSDKDLIATKWEGAPNTFNGQLIAGKVEMFDVLCPKLDTWEEFREMFGDDRFCCERGYYKRAEQLIGLDKIDFVDIEIGNRFNQVDNNVWPDDVFACNYIDGPTLSISGISNREYDISYQAGGKEIYTVKQKVGMWSKAAIKYFMPWTIEASLNGEVKFRKELDLDGARVLISLGSKALGDTIAWMPYIDEFRKKHNCKVVCSGWWQEIFDYPEIEWVKPGSEVADIVASYQVGCFDEQPNMNPKDWRLTPLQKVAADILGLEYEPIRAKLKFTPHKRGNGGVQEPYICFSEFSTMKNKLWNRPGAWKNIIDYLNGLGYKCVSISNEESQLDGVVKHNSQSIQNSIADIAGADFYIGLNAGPSWIAYALGVPVIMITGVSEEWNDFPNPHRIAINNEVCGIGCFNDPTHKIDRGWLWCPRNKEFACTRDITEEMVIDVINKVIAGVSYAVKEGEEQGGHKFEYSGDDKEWASENTSNSGSPEYSA